MVESGSYWLSGGLNTYAYVGNNPVNYYDPLGLKRYPDNFIGPLLPEGYYESEMTVTDCGDIPPAPPGVDIDKNILLANVVPKVLGWRLLPLSAQWLYNQVENKGPWDYKQIERKYEDFGNFHFGATASSFGLPSSVAKRGAGWGQSEGR